MTRDALAYHGCAELFQVSAYNLEMHDWDVLRLFSEFDMCPLTWNHFPRMYILNWSSTKGLGWWNVGLSRGSFQWIQLSNALMVLVH